MVCMYTPAPAAALPVELELLSECCVLSMAFLVHSLLLAAIITETSVANLGVKIEKLYSVGCGMVSALHIAPFILQPDQPCYTDCLGGSVLFQSSLGLGFSVCSINESYKGSKVTMMNLDPSQSRPLYN